MDLSKSFGVCCYFRSLSLRNLVSSKYLYKITLVIWKLVPSKVQQSGKNWGLLTTSTLCQPCKWTTSEVKPPALVLLSDDYGPANVWTTASWDIPGQISQLSHSQIFTHWNQETTNVYYCCLKEKSRVSAYLLCLDPGPKWSTEFRRGVCQGDRVQISLLLRGACSVVQIT